MKQTMKQQAVVSPALLSVLAWAIDLSAAVALASTKPPGGGGPCPSSPEPFGCPAANLKNCDSRRGENLNSQINKSNHASDTKEAISLNRSRLRFTRPVNWKYV